MSLWNPTRRALKFLALQEVPDAALELFHDAEIIQKAMGSCNGDPSRTASTRHASCRAGYDYVVGRYAYGFHEALITEDTALCRPQRGW
jgi:hypothetical protein